MTAVHAPSHKDPYFQSGTKFSYDVQFFEKCDHEQFEFHYKKK